MHDLLIEQVDDRSLPKLLRRKSAHQSERAPEIHLEMLPVARFRPGSQLARLEHRGVVDEDIDRPAGFEQLRSLPRNGEVGRQNPTPLRRRQQRSQLPGFVARPPDVKPDIGSRRGEGADQLRPDPARAAGDENGFSINIHEFSRQIF